jgi:hypothetical protein
LRLLLVLALAGCNHQALEPDDVDLAGADLVVADLTVTPTAEVITCCGGPPIECIVDAGACVPPMMPCGVGGCYLPCTPAPNYSVPVPAGCLGSADLCKCIMDHGGGDPCYPNGGSSCGFGTGNTIQCLCY